MEAEVCGFWFSCKSLTVACQGVVLLDRGSESSPVPSEL
jgi:hypothetical protein